MLQLRFIGVEKPPVWLVEETYVLGSGAGCHIHLADPSVKSRHAQLSVRDEKLSITPTGDDASVIVNGNRVYGQTALAHDSAVQLGECHLRIVDPKRERPAAPPASSTTSSPWVLQSKTTALANKLFPVEGDMIVGRARECDLSLAVAHLSRRHARLFFDGGALWVEDLGSANGTFLNGRRVDRARLRDADELAFDTLVFVVRGEPSAEPEQRDDKTSLRPAIATEIATSPPERIAKAVAMKSSEPIKPNRDRPLARADDVGTGQSPLLLWGGIATAVLLTALAIFYFAA